jgi:hypothetical protein
MPNPDEVVCEDMLPGIYLSAQRWKGKKTVMHGRHEHHESKLAIDFCK